MVVGQSVFWCSSTEPIYGCGGTYRGSTSRGCNCWICQYELFDCWSETGHNRLCSFVMDSQTWSVNSDRQGRGQSQTFLHLNLEISTTLYNSPPLL